MIGRVVVLYKLKITFMSIIDICVYDKIFMLDKKMKNERSLTNNFLHSFLPSLTNRKVSESHRRVALSDTCVVDCVVFRLGLGLFLTHAEMN